MTPIQSVYRSMSGIATGLAMGLTVAAMPGAPTAHAEPVRHHALSLVDAPAYGPDFKHFDWVNPDAPKGGVVRLSDEGSFDTLNPFTIKGEPAGGIGLIYDTLMATSLDEPSTEYGHVAEWVSFPDDLSSATFKLRPEARFHDGKPVTAADVIFSLNALKAAHPFFAGYFKNVTSAEETAPGEVTFRFDMTGNRELPQILGGLTVLPKHYWEAAGADGQPRDLSKTTMEVPLGSGPYRIKSVDPGRGIVYERVADYWAKDLPAMRGQYNIGEIRYTYYRDRVPAFESFKGGQIDFWQETSANAWATQYEIDAVKAGQLVKEAVPHQRVASMQAFAFNIRRGQFADARVRRAFGLAFNFEEANRGLFYGMYRRTTSYFDNSELKATGLPEGAELALLEAVRDKVPAEVFTTAPSVPTAADATAHRNNLREAVRLFAEAGWTLQGGKLVNAAGEQLKAEFLLVSPDFERIVLPYVSDLKRLGVDASVRMVDSSQYTRRIESFDFDIITANFPQSHSPGNEQRDFFGSAAADRNGSRNVIGIKNPAIDALIEELVKAKDRAGVVAASRAVDRVLMWNHYVVPQWHYPFDRIAHWDIFGKPGKLPSQSPGALQVRWIDPAKAEALAGKRRM
ncbi:MAG: extracellular solute-binding protein [Hyphomicrobiaceae bacterium]|nr:extracellular solute-binding protein [Hyphomicrobiaceae bacterium]